MPSVTALPGMIGRKVGMMTLYDGVGNARGVTAIDLADNRITQIRTSDRDQYEAVQVGAPGKRKRITRPQQGHLRAAGAERVALSALREFRVTDIAAFEVGQALSVDQFEPGTYVNVTATSKGRGFAGGVRRWNFRGGPKTHGQSDRHRAPGSIGAGTTPGRVWKGQKMAGHMGAERKTVLNLLVVYIDAARNLLFVEGSVPGPRNGLVSVTLGRRNPLADYQPPILTLPEIEAVEEELIEEAPAEEAPSAEMEQAPEEPAAEAREAPAEAVAEVPEEPAAEDAAPAAEATDAEPSETDETKDEGGA